jgi:hypothetical protein
MKMYGGVLCIDPCFLDLGTSWRWVVSFMPWPIYLPGKRSQYWIGDWVGPEDGLDHMKKWNFNYSVVEPVASRYTECTTMP